VASEPRYLVDSGLLVGLLSKSDQWHSWSHQALTLIEEPVMTTETVLAEVCHLVGPYRATMLQVTGDVGVRTFEGLAGSLRAARAVW